MKTKTNWELLKNMKDSEIDYSDIPETDYDFWDDAKILIPQNQKVEVKIKVDKEIALWIKKFGKKSDVTVNNILHSYFDGLNNLQLNKV